MNPSTAFGTVLADELVRCGLREAVLAPGSRSAPLALALYALSRLPAASSPGATATEPDGPAFPRKRAPGSQAGDPGGPAFPRKRAAEFQAADRPALRLHVRIDERSAAFLALGLAKASGRPVLVVCTSGTAAAHLHAAVIEADEAAVPLIVLTADRPPELRDTGANQTIDQLKLYGGAVRWFCEAGVPEARAGMAGYWRSLACRAWAQASGAAGSLAGPVHVNVPLREPLVPGPGDEPGWPEPLDGRPGGAQWTGFGEPQPAWPSLPDTPARSGPAVLDGATARSRARSGTAAQRTSPGGLEIDWTERGVVFCGDGAEASAGPLLQLAERAGWPVLAEPSSAARRGPNALLAYPYLLATPAFVAGHRPDVIISAGRPGLSRGQLAYLQGAPGGPPARHIVLASGPGHWADPARSASEVADQVGLRRQARAASRPADSAWLGSWRRADAAARRAVDAMLDETGPLTEPRLARDLAAALPDGALLWAASSLPIRDLDQQMRPRAGLRVLASRGASGIDGLVSAAIGAALAHQADGGGAACALLGDLAFLHDAPGLMLGPEEPRPDLCIVVVNNDGGGIFSSLEQAAIPGPFERLFGTPHGAGLGSLAAAAGLPHSVLDRLAGLPGLLAGGGLRIVEVRTQRPAGAALRARLQAAAAAAISAELGSRPA